jgi:nucleoside-diphosphate-sugar epimerase
MSCKTNASRSAGGSVFQHHQQRETDRVGEQRLVLGIGAFRAIIHQATALANVRFGRSLDRAFGPTNRLRTEGTDALLAAAREAGVRRFVAQSFASYRYAREGGPVKTEDDRLDPDPPAMAIQANAAMRHLDEAVAGARGPDQGR